MLCAAIDPTGVWHMTGSAPRKKTLQTKLRFGWTTGTCATAAVNAAYTAMVTGQFPDRVTIVTPSGKNADLEVADMASGHDDSGSWFRAGIVKDAGDDPDVTHGALIRATVWAARPGSGVSFRGGEGVGTVTKPGLPIPAGEPAINPVPREMMQGAISDLAAALRGPEDVEIEISVPDGAQIALKTWNPVSASKAAFRSSGQPVSYGHFPARPGLRPSIAGSMSRGPMRSPMSWARQGRHQKDGGAPHTALPDIALIDMGDFVGGMLKYMRRHPVPNLSILGGFGKMVKLSQGATDLHSARSQVDFDRLAGLAFGVVWIGRVSPVPIRFSRSRRWRAHRSVPCWPMLWLPARWKRRWPSCMVRRRGSRS